jgi:hypothetical protein
MVLKFNHVDFVNLTTKKYLFIYNSKFYSGKCIEKNVIAHFINVHSIKKIYNSEIKITEMYIKPDFCDFFELNSQKHIIQAAMEHRALQKILQKIIGDTYFIW